MIAELEAQLASNPVREEKARMAKERQGQKTVILMGQNAKIAEL